MPLFSFFFFVFFILDSEEDEPGGCGPNELEKTSSNRDTF